jgi:hypothetical protein
MYPTQPSRNTKSRAELVLFDEFQKKLDDSFSVIHSKRWIDPDKKNGKRTQGECDFIVIHPSKGILFIEAKSGKTFYCSAINEYWHKVCVGNTFRNPLNQIINCQWAIIKILNRQLGIDLKLPYNYAIAFPEADKISGNLPDELLPQMVIIKTDLAKLQIKIEKALGIFTKPLNPPISTELYNRILALFRSEFTIMTSLSSQIEDLNAQFFQLEKEQVYVLDQFEDNKRVLVEGCAGSGKTVIAIEKAQRSFYDGKRVLLLCYNIPLAKQLREKAKDLKINIDIYSFHALCEHVVKATGGSFIVDGDDLKNFYNIKCPELLMDSIPLFSKKYDCIIVDEAQDFVSEWWIPIMDLMDDSKKSEIFIFRDLNQNIFSRDSFIPIENMFNIKLNINYRNTPAIIKWINKKCQTRIIPSKRLDEGIDPTVKNVKDGNEEFVEVQNIVSKLINKEGIKPNQIVILGRNPKKHSIFNSIDSIGGCKLTESQLLTESHGCIRYSSIYKFKGLEAECVLFTGLGNGRNDMLEDMSSVLLTGASRAKSLLYVFGDYLNSL